MHATYSKARVSQVQDGAVNAEVVLTLPGGEQLVAVVTLESIRNLGIAVGKEAVALIKAPWVMLMTESSDIRLLRPQLPGRQGAERE